MEENLVRVVLKENCRSSFNEDMRTFVFDSGAKMAEMSRSTLSTTSQVFASVSNE